MRLCSIPTTSESVDMSPIIQCGEIHMTRNILLPDKVIGVVIDPMSMITHQRTLLLAVQHRRWISIVDGQDKPLFQRSRYLADPFRGFQVDLCSISPV